jgi:hypothetical protein
VDPAWWAQIKAGQTARVQAGKAACREASARAIPVTDAEIALYGAGHQDADSASRPQPPGRQPQAEDSPETVPETQPPRTEATAGDHDSGARISKAITDLEDAVQRSGAEQAGRRARSEYAARIARQAEAQPEAMAEPHTDLSAQALDEAEIG